MISAVSRRSSAIIAARFIRAAASSVKAPALLSAPYRELYALSIASVSFSELRRRSRFAESSSSSPGLRAAFSNSAI